MGVQRPPLQRLSCTLQAARLTRTAIFACKTILSPALDVGCSTVSLPQALMLVCINKLTG